ncbi:MAG TPA: MdtA/MuxA family multidrug efflux RND transporter periplasmic adaptor subunit [Steroidobacteraceae bacterium]|nr:MdtA/MuxA family multidrug efflux RND transporter periplasmic adaptor subunit [Steroidobacteraceae bacterium]
MINEQDPQLYPPARESKSFIVRHWKALLIVLAVVLLMIAFTLYLRQKQPLAAPPRGRNGQGGPVAVSVATAAVGDIQVKIPALGTVTPLATVTVRTQITGTLQKIFFTEGQAVHQGDALAQIDPRPYEAALQQMQGNLMRDQALLANAKVDLKRYVQLVKDDSIAEQQLDTQRALVDQLVGTIQADEGQVKTAQVNLVYTHIIAPVSGRVGLRQVDQGNYVTPGDANGIVLINQLQPITVIFNIPEDNVSAVMKRVQSGAPLTVEAFDRTNATKIADGKLLTVDNSIDITTGTVKLRAQFDNTDSSLFPNQFVNIQLLQDVLKDQIIMPNAAVRRGAPNGVATTFVYSVNADSTVSVRPVTLGVVDGEKVAVTAGLKAGDVVVTEGGDRLRDGAQVQLPSAAPAPAAGAQPPGKPGAPATPGARRGKGRGKPPPSP